MSEEAIHIRQLIYTNVEAEQSPTRQRGFQIWQWSKELSPDERKLVGERLKDYRLPPGTTTKDGGKVHRHLYCRAGSDLNVIARTVPMEEKDKFGRGGKFFAHAVILTDQAFEQIGCQPFRILESGFRFLHSPQELIDHSTGIDWKTGELPDELLLPSSLQSAVAASPVSCAEADLVKIRGYLQHPGDLTIVLPYPATIVSEQLRRLFSLLPASLRKQWEFDTLSTGSSLQHVKFRIVGSYSPDALRMWSFRRYATFDLERLEFKPKFAAAMLEPPLAVIVEPEWQRLGENDRQQFFAIMERLSHHCESAQWDPSVLSAKLTDALDSSQSVRTALEKAILKKATRELPHLLAERPTFAATILRQFEELPSQAIAQLAEPIFQKLLDDALVEKITAPPVQRPSVKVLKELESRIRRTGDSQLEWIVRCWRATDEDLQEIEDELGSIQSQKSWLRDWLRDWLRATLPDEFGNPEDPAELQTQLASAQNLSREQLVHARLFLACLPDRTQYHWLTARLNLALATSVEAFSDFLRLHARAMPVHEWLRDQVIQAFQNRWIAGWANDGLKLQIGLFLDPKSPQDRTILQTFIEHGTGHGKEARYLFQRLWPLPVVHKSPDGSSKPERPLPDQHKSAFQKLLKAEPHARRPCIQTLRDTLRTPDNTGFCWVANNLLDNGGGRWRLQIENDQDGNNEIGFVGLELEPIIRQPYLSELFEAVASSMVPEVIIGKPLPEYRKLDGLAQSRFSWFISRMANNVETQKLTLN